MTGLLQGTQLTGEQGDFVDTIRTSGDALLTIINDILDFSKIEAGILELDYSAFNLRTCIEEVLELFAAKADEKGLELIYFLGDGVPETVIGDVLRLRQILVNLVGNAVKFTEFGEITVKVNAVPMCRTSENTAIVYQQDGDGRNGQEYEVHFEVQDSGIGIPKDRIDRLFKSFSQVDASTTRNYGGTGLGLAISKKLSELMGGRIWVESEMESGSTFHFTIKARAAPVPNRSARQSDYKGPIGEEAATLLPLRILVAEDNPVNQKVILRILERIGYKADLAGNGLEVIAFLGRQQYDVVLMDVHMPEMDGLEASRRIRKQWLDGRPRIIAMTASAMRGDKESCLAAGMDDYITKPVRIDELKAALDRSCHAA
jgi:CheY-like chemotaxis protein